MGSFNGLLRWVLQVGREQRRRVVEQRQQAVALLSEVGQLIRRKLSGPGAIGESGRVDEAIALAVSDEEVVMEVRPRGAACRSDETDGLFLFDVCAHLQPAREPAQVAVTRLVAVSMPDFDVVAEGASPTPEDDDARGGRPDTRAVRRGIVDAVVREVLLQDGGGNVGWNNRN